MTSISILIAFSIAIIAILSLRWSLWNFTQEIERVFAAREPLDEDSFYQRYFQQRGVPADIPIRVRRILEEELDVDLSRLAADDDFTTNLKFFWDFDSLADTAIVLRLEEEFGIAIADDELEHIRTVSDIIEMIWSKLHQNY